MEEVGNDMLSIYDSEEYSDVVSVMVKCGLHFWTHSLKGKTPIANHNNTVSRHFSL